MKKIIIITGIVLLSISVFAQQNPRDRARQNDQNRKSAVTARRTVQNNNKKAVTARRTVQNNNRKAVTSSRTVQNNNRKAVTSRKGQATRKSEPAVRRPEQGQKRATTATRPVPNHKRETTRQKVPNHKKETTTRRSVPDHNRETSTRRPVPSHNKGTSTRRSIPDHSRETVTRRPDTQNRKDVSRTRANGRYTGTPDRHAEHRRNYTTPNRMHVRKTHHAKVHYVPVKHRKIHYRSPRHVHVIWTPRMYREYRILYPDFHYWYYPTGYRIITIPAYNSYFHIGEVRNVYGRVHEVWYSWSTDEYYLYFGGSYPYHDFTVILPGRDARRFARYPESFFAGRYIWVTGLVSTFEGKPEILVRRTSQVHLY